MWAELGDFSSVFWIPHECLIPHGGHVYGMCIKIRMMKKLYLKYCTTGQLSSAFKAEILLHVRGSAERGFEKTLATLEASSHC
ncbi:hypothetical protein Y1Q_0023698 [Alligator mississippiensis]|uniref:Uncharacterized protein n=1 Tax=Alligator mississippiensis TaxID=8496 RepID=A0A151NCM1_ALLMI|nr:hypothetical protein Y1Q_0023698 [Alligator mississippiensis]